MQQRTETWWGTSQLETCDEQVQGLEERLARKIVAGELGEVFSA